MEFKDYYKILGVTADADSKQIKAAYRKLALKHHPDMSAVEGSEAKFKESAEAYKVLKNPERRAEYDELRKYGQRSEQEFTPPPGWQTNQQAHANEQQFDGDFSDFFNSIFGQQSSHSRQHTRAPSGHQRGQDVEIELPVFLEETIQQHKKTVEYQLPHIRNGQLEHIDKHLKVTIPLGVSDGERIRVVGQGKPSPTGGKAGDLYLHIRLVPHPLFDVQGHNLLVSLPLAPWEAALGTKVTLPTLEGRIHLSIPPNTQAGSKLRIKGKGLKTKNINGDLFAVVKITMPSEANQQSHLWQELAKNSDFNPRSEWEVSS
ncbi:DnaJ C-terminal domain-containing protein [Agarivorans sp. MS3-6]